MEINMATIDKLSALSKLEFEEQEKLNLQIELQKMLDFVKKLSEVDTEGIEPLMHISNQYDVFRKDEIAGDFSVNDALSNANNKNEQFFLVPKVINK